MIVSRRLNVIVTNDCEEGVNPTSVNRRDPQYRNERSVHEFFG